MLESLCKVLSAMVGTCMHVSLTSLAVYLAIWLVVLSPKSVFATMDNCGSYGIPQDIDSVTSHGDSLLYKCKKHTILLGDGVRKCLHGSYTGSVPVCMPLLKAELIDNLEGNASILVLKPTSTCVNGPVWMTFGKTHVNYLFVWTNGACNQNLSIIIDKNEHKFESSFEDNRNQSVITHVFEVKKLIESVSIGQQCCINQIAISNPSVSIQCGKPDLPRNGQFKEMGHYSGLFSCSKGYKLNDSNIGSTKCIGLEQWSSSNFKCSKSKVWIWILLSCLVAVILVVCSIFLGVLFIFKSDVDFDKDTLFKEVVSNYPGLKTDMKDVLSMTFLENDDQCTVFTAKYKGVLVLAHVCQTGPATSQNESNFKIESIRCLFQAVSHDYKHPNLLSLLAISNNPKQSPVLIFDFYPNGHLDQFVRTNQLPVNKLLQLATDVCNGMAFISQKRIVHNNLRARSCYVDGSLNVKVGNFKYCQDLDAYDQFKSKDAITRERMPWAAPETIAENISSSKSDVWSYGVLLWEVFSRGAEPFTGKTDLQITSFLLQEKRLLQPTNCSTKLYMLMLDCWRNDSNERPTFGDLNRSIKEQID